MNCTHKTADFLNVGEVALNVIFIADVTQHFCSSDVFLDVVEAGELVDPFLHPLPPSHAAQLFTKFVETVAG
jgi:hypothetical protein